MNDLLSYAIWYYLLFLAFIGAITLFLIALAIRDWYKCKRIHKDSNKTNNRVENLEWVTPSENKQHNVENGLHNPPRGSRQGNSKLTKKDVLHIRLLYKKRYTDKKGAKTMLNQMRNDPKIARALPYRPNRVYYCEKCGGWHITSVRKHYPIS